MVKVVVVTGSLGFIGNQVTRKCLQEGWQVMGIDNHTYAANLAHLEEFTSYPNYAHMEEDISKLTWLPECDYVINTAAETHVDNSIAKSSEFMSTNITGVYNILELIRHKTMNVPTLIHFSTDEVYGDIAEGSHDEKSTLKPSNPYSASKASADQLVIAWNRTYGIPYVIVRPTNNYGPLQYHEKLIPKVIRCINMEKKIPLHNNGTPTRMWLHSEDTAYAVLKIIDSKVYNEIYNISGDTELSNMQVVTKILKAYNPDIALEGHLDFTFSRAGQDVRYSIDDSKLRDLGWKPCKDFDTEIVRITKSPFEFLW